MMLKERNLLGLFLCSEGGFNMPRKPLKPCAVSGCSNLCEGTYCDLHRKKNNKDYSRFFRSDASRSFYNSKEWKALRKKFLSEHPLCACCLSEGRYTPAKIVDHIIPIKMGGKTLDESNPQSLCWSCHSKKSNNEGSAGFAKK